MKAFIRSGIVDECLKLVEVKSCEWPKGYVDWVYENYPDCYKIIEEFGEVEINNLPGQYEFLDWKNYVGSLPGVHPVYKATEEKIKIFMETKQKIEKEKAEKERKWREEHEKWKRERKELRKQFTVIKTYLLQHPKGGEDGQDGYFDADLQHITGKVVRMVARNVFDFGFYTYPKRVEGTDDVFESEEWTEIEKQADKWLRNFSPFTTCIRM